MSATTVPAQEEVQRASAWIQELRSSVNQVIVGQENLLQGLMIGLLTDGHVLLEGVPGLAKTLAVSSLARAVRGSFTRLQFTPDLLPSDLVGTEVYNAREASFTRAQGPDLRQLRAGRRGQPRAGQGAVGAARVDAGAPGLDRRPDLPAAAALPGAGDAESDRAGGHLPAARGAARPFRAQDHRQAPQARRRARDPRPHGQHAGPSSTCSRS